MGNPADAGRRIAALLGHAPSAPPPGRIQSMLAARRRIIDQPMVEGIATDGLVPDALVSRRSGANPYPAGDLPWEVADMGAQPVKSGDALGTFYYAPADGDFLGVATYPKSGGYDTRRHEIMHGYNEAARRGYAGMPFWSRAVGASPDFISIPLDELIAQRAGGTAFMDIPWSVYASLYAQGGQAGAARTARALEAAQMARRVGGQAVEFAGDHPVLLGAGLGTAYLLGRAMAGEDEAEPGQ